MDKRRQELEELQDDIHLALLMDEYADSMGAEVRAEAEKAFENGELSIPKDVDDACASILAQTTKAERSRKTTKNVIRYLLVAVGTVIALLGTLVVVQAAGIDVFGRLASWTDSVFHYSSEEKPARTEEEPFSEIDAVLRGLNIPTEFAPYRLPDGYVVSSIKQTETDKMKIVGIRAEKGEKTIRISIEEHLVTEMVDHAQWEKTAKSVKEYTSNGRMFYLFENELGWSGTWTDGRYIISLFGFESMDELEQTIDSMRGN